MDYTQLAQVLSGSAYAQMTAAQILIAVNTQSGSPGAIPTATALIWAAENNVRATLETLSATSGPLQSVALATLDMFRGASATLDLSSPAVQQMIGALQAGGAITATQAASLNALGLPPSVAMATLGRVATAEDITQAQLMQQLIAMRKSAVLAQNAVFASLNAIAAQINAGSSPAIPTTTQVGSTYTGAL